MKRLLALMKKNFKLLIRSKSSALIIILGPLLLIMLVGAAFNTASIYGVRVGVFSEEYSPLSEAIIHELNENKYASQKVDTEQSCIDGVKNGVFHVCAIFPPNLKVAAGGDVTFYVDNTKQNVIYLITDTISSHIGEKSKDLSTQLTKGVIDTLDDVEAQIIDREQLLDEVLLINQEQAEGLKVVNQELLDLDLQFYMDEFPFSTLESEVNKLNSTSASGAFEGVKRGMENIIKETDKAATTQKRSAEKISAFVQNAENSRFSITQMQYTFRTIKNDIKSVKETGVGRIVNPLRSEIKPIATEKTHLNFIFPTLLAMIIMLVSILLTSTLEIRERTSKVYFKNFITPTSDLAFTLSNYLTNLFIIGFQVLILLGVATYFFTDGIFASLPLLVPALLLIISFFLFLGITLGNLFKTEETNTICAISIGFILIFFSSAILPIETLPTVIKSIANFNPFYISETLLNKIILFQSPFEVVKEKFFFLGAYLLGVVALSIIVKKMSKRRE